MKAILLLALALTTGCDVEAQIGLTPDGGVGQQTWAELRLASPTDKVDVLFVIDDSPSMAPKQAELAARFPSLLGVLDQFRDQGRPGRYHLGVITTDLGAGPFTLAGGQCQPGGRGGRLQSLGAAAASSCQSPVGAAYIDYDQAVGTSNLPAGQDLAATFGCMARVGDRGCGFEQPLEAARVALGGGLPENDGFLRQDAVLAVVFVTDEDDCSAPAGGELFDPARASDFGVLDSYRCTRFGLTCGGVAPPAAEPAKLSGCVPATTGHLYDPLRYRTFFGQPRALGGVKDNPADVLLFAISAPPVPVSVALGTLPDPVTGQSEPCDGPPNGSTCVIQLLPSCARASQPGFSATPSVRLQAVVGTPIPDGAPAFAGSICDNSYAATLEAFGRLLGAAQNGSGCVPGPLPDSRDPRCAVEEIRPGTAEPVRALPSCVGNVAPCWRVIPGAQCPAMVSPRTGRMEQLRMEIDRGGAPTADGVIVRARCVVLTG